MKRRVTLVLFAALLSTCVWSCTVAIATYRVSPTTVKIIRSKQLPFPFTLLGLGPLWEEEELRSTSYVGQYAEDSDVREPVTEGMEPTALHDDPPAGLPILGAEEQHSDLVGHHVTVFLKSGNSVTGEIIGFNGLVFQLRTPDQGYRTVFPNEIERTEIIHSTSTD